MTTAIAPGTRLSHERVLLSTVESRGERHHRYRWTVSGIGPDGTPVEPLSGEATASEPIEPLSREILEDRWSGIAGEGTKLGGELDRLLFDLAEGLTRRDMQDEALIDGQVVGLAEVMDTDALEHVIREWMIERAGKVAAS